MNATIAAQVSRLVFGWAIIFHVPVPFWIKILSVLLMDTFDCVPSTCESRDYQQVDKLVDTTLYAMLLLLSYKELPEQSALFTGLFLFRLAGVLAYELTGKEQVLIYFPDFFIWFLLISAVLHGHFRWNGPDRKVYLAAYTVASLLKVFQEVQMHGSRAREKRI